MGLQGQLGVVRTCGSCGRSLDEHDRFCSYCRAPVGVAAALATRCTKCGEASPAGATSCEWCGAALPEAQFEAPTCRVCGQHNRPDARFCLSCGGPFVPGLPTSKGSQAPRASTPAKPSLLELFAGRWTVAIRIAVLGTFIGLAIITLLATVLVAIAAGIDGWDALTGTSDFTTSFLKIFGIGVVSLWAAAQGATGFAMVFGTGLAWAGLSLVLATRIVAPSKRSDPYIALGIAVKTGVVYGGIILGATYVLASMTASSFLDLITGSDALSGGGGFPSVPDIGPLSGLLPIGGLIGGFLIASVAVLLTFARNGGWSPVEALGTQRPSRTVRAAWRGGVKTLVGSGVAFLILAVVGIVLGLATVAFDEGGLGTPAQIATGITVIVVGFLFAGVDVAFVAIVGSVFLLFQGGGIELFGENVDIPPAAFLALVVPGVAALRGGAIAARHSKARDRVGAARAGALSGVAAGAVITAWMLLFFTRIEAVGNGVTALLATGGSSLVFFVVLGTIGGTVFANRKGLPDRALSERTPIPRIDPVAPPADPPADPEVPASRFVPAPSPPPVLAPPVPHVAVPRLPVTVGTVRDVPAVAPAAPAVAPVTEPIAAVAETMATVSSREVWSELDALSGTAPQEDEDPAPRARRAPSSPVEGPCIAPCSATNPPGTRFCGYCGRDLMPTKACTDCGCVQSAELRYCRDCGSAFN